MSPNVKYDLFQTVIIKDKDFHFQIRRTMQKNWPRTYEFWSSLRSSPWALVPIGLGSPGLDPPLGFHPTPKRTSLILLPHPQACLKPKLKKEFLNTLNVAYQKDVKILYFFGNRILKKSFSDSIEYCYFFIYSIGRQKTTTIFALPLTFWIKIL